ncbi:hypothetical protein SUGI_0689730 [Cryptomeria japonica]|nr:hypothetical protein SUGI_0689730 [Cryptomeria japonica]
MRAIKKRATWLPSKAFSLTGVTVQIIVWWTSLSYLTNECRKEVGVNELVVLHQIVVSGKVALCVFIGYLLPGMTAPSVRTFLTVGTSVCVQIASELLILYKQHDKIPEDNKDWSSWAQIANSILVICLIVLGLTLVCTILGSQTLHGLLRQRTSAISSMTKEDDSNERRMPISWKDFEDQVLSSWLVVRVCQSDYVISRSVFSSAVGIVVTLSVLISLLSNTFHDMYFSDRPFVLLDYAIFCFIFSFILIRWIVICWRWLAAQFYFRSHRQSWRRCLCMEDFWTRSTVELIHMCDLKSDRQQFQDDERSTSDVHRSLTKIITKVRWHKLLYLVLMLQWSVVFFSKLCGLLSEVIIGNFLYRLRTHMRNGHPAVPEKYEGILKLICMPGEEPIDMWAANKMSFDKAKDLLQKHCKKGGTGGSTEELNSVFPLNSLQWAKDRTTLLDMLQKSALQSVLDHFPSVEKQYVRITVVSLITILIRLRKAKSARFTKVLKACREVWDLLSFADECDIDLQAKEISIFEDLNKDKDQVCMAAEREFYKLQMEYNKLDRGSEDCVRDVQEARGILQDLLEKCKRVLEQENLLGGKKEAAENLSDSKDWMEIAPKYTQYKLCRLMLHEHIEDFVAWTEDALKNVIAFSLSRLPDMLVKQCWKWAQEFDEDKLWEAIDLAGKCKGMMEDWEPKPKLTRNATKQRTIQDMPLV